MELDSPGPAEDEQRLLSEKEGDEASADGISDPSDTPAPQWVSVQLHRIALVSVISVVEHCCSVHGLLLLGFLFVVPSSAVWFTALLLAARPFRFCKFMVWLPVVNTLGLVAATVLLIKWALALLRGAVPSNPAKLGTSKNDELSCRSAICGCCGAVLHLAVWLLAIFSFLCSPWMAIVVLRYHLTVMDWDVVTQLQAVDGIIRIQRDATGLPSVTALTPADVSFAQGYLHARDQLFRMEVQRLAAHGQLSTLLGSSAVPADTLARTLDFTALAKQVLAKLSPAARQHCDAFADGVNAAMHSREFRWSPEFYFLWHTPPPWTAEDVILAFKLFQWLTATANDAELARWQLFAGRNLSHSDIEQLFPPEQPTNSTPVLTGDQQQQQQWFLREMQGTVQAEAKAYTELESWLGRRGLQTAAGQHLPASKMHPTVISPTQLPGHQQGGNVDLAAKKEPPPSQGLAFLRRAVGYWTGGVAWASHNPSLMRSRAFLAYEATGGASNPQMWYPLSVSAAVAPTAREAHTLLTYPGLPGCVMGSNDALAWGSTPLLSDQTDYFVLTPVGADRYLQNGSPVPFEVFDHLIEVRGGGTVPLQVRRSCYGPVVTTALRLAGGLPVAINCEALQADPESFEAFVSLWTARTVMGFQAHLRELKSPALATVMVDSTGSMVYVSSGLHRKRAVGHSGRFPIPGTGQYDYVGRVDPADMPTTTRRTGSVIAAGNAPTAGGMAAGTVLGYEWKPPYRYKRISQLLELMGPRPAAADHMLIQTDAVDAFAVQDFRELLDQLPVPAASEAQSLQRELLEFWDGQQDGGAEAQLYSAFRQQLTDELENWAYEGMNSGIDRYWPLDDSWAIVKTYSRPPTHFKQHCAAALSRDALPDACMAWAASLWVSLAKPPVSSTPPPTGSEGCTLCQPAVRHAWWGRACSCLWDRPLGKLGGRHTISDVYCAGDRVEIPAVQLVLDTLSGYTLLQLPLGHSGNPFDVHYDDWAADYTRNEYRMVSPT